MKNGFEIVDFGTACDVTIINTCSITEVSDSKSRKIILQALRANPHAIIAVMGCYSQLQAEEIKKIPGVSIIIGTKHRDQLFSMVMDVLKSKQQIINIEDNRHYASYEELKVSRFINKTRSFVKIEDGCDNFCSYCTIPYARGRVRSRDKTDIINEIKALTQQNIQEIVLTGINTGSYGKDLLNYRLVDLLIDIINEVPNVGRIRISSIELKELSDELLSFIYQNKKYFCNHLHIPLQGGIDKILTKMNRKYTLREYQNRINEIRFLFPKINITTDIMVGFNGETDEDFNIICENIRAMKFGEMHVFPYSPRPLTASYHFLDPVDSVSKNRRVKEMLDINNELAVAYRKQFLNEVLEVLVEKCENGQFLGHSSEYLTVIGKGLVDVNTMLKVKIIDASYPNCKGVIDEL